MSNKKIYLKTAPVSLAFDSFQNKEDATISAISHLIPKNSSDISGTVSFTESNDIVSMKLCVWSFIGMVSILNVIMWWNIGKYIYNLVT
jgi:hypothetical protein